MYVNKCIKCGREFETKNPKRVICPDCLYPDKSMMVSSSTSNEEQQEAPKPLNGYSAGGTEEPPRYYSAGGDDHQRHNNRPQQRYNQGGYNNNRNNYNRGYNNNRQQGGYNRDNKVDLTDLKDLIIINKGASKIEDLVGLIIALIIEDLKLKRLLNNFLLAKNN